MTFIRRAVLALPLVLTGLWLPTSTQAQIVAPGGRTLFNRAVMIRSFVRVDNFAEGAPNLRVRRIVNPYAVVWGAYPHLNLTFVAPLVIAQTEDATDPSRNLTTTSFADGLVFARYDLLRKNVRAGFTRLSPEIGLKVPSGSAFSSGSTDAIAALIFSHIRDPHWLIADAQFTYTTTGEGGLRLGNHWNYDLAYLYRVLPRQRLDTPAFYLVLELNGEHERRARLNGMKLPNSGGDLLFLSPGIELQTYRWVLEFSSPIPIGRDLNGSQLRSTSSFIAGIRWLF
ncbi:MAG: hypothetical protein HY653_06905 [Acidobacteria bacterium]|nr:hypothetical protein [Acidobacteriota bacterium]